MESSLIDFRNGVDYLSRTNAGYQCGYIYDPEAVRIALLSGDIVPSEDTSVCASFETLPDQVFQWEAARKYLGKLLKSMYQDFVGSCVGCGTGRAVDYTVIIQIARMFAEFLRVSPESVYALSRYEWNNGRVPFRGDGSTGAWAAGALKKFGYLVQRLYGSVDLSSYSPHRARQWGASGLPDHLEPEARQKLVTGVTLVKNWEHAKKLLASGYSIAICSGLGFTMARDADGFCRPRGIWRHCMNLNGYQLGRREGGHLENSWGDNAHTGPVGAGNPGPEGFWADADYLDKGLREGDSYAFSAVQGIDVFPSRLVYKV